MLKRYKITALFLVLGVLLTGVFPAVSGAADVKIGYVDLRRAFYEYEKAKNLEQDLASLTDTRQADRTRKIEAITKLRDEAELLSGDVRAKKQSEIDVELVKLQEFDRETRQELLTKKNDMFKEVIEDIQKVVADLGEKEGYAFVFDSRNIMYSQDQFDLTDKVLKELNK